jgi:hypothetical protein
VVVPTVEQTDRRLVSRERCRLLHERIALSNRIGGLLASPGVPSYRPLKRDHWLALAASRIGDGRALPARLKTEVERMLVQLELPMKQIKAARRSTMPCRRRTPRRKRIRDLDATARTGLGQDVMACGWRTGADGRGPACTIMIGWRQRPQARR